MVAYFRSLAAQPSTIVNPLHAFDLFKNNESHFLAPVLGPRGLGI